MFDISLRRLHQAIVEAARVYRWQVLTIDDIQLLDFKQLMLLSGWPLAGNPVAEALLLSMCDVLGGLMSGEIPPANAETTIALQDLAEKLDAPSPELRRMLFAPRGGSGNTE